MTLDGSSSCSNIYRSCQCYAIVALRIDGEWQRPKRKGINNIEVASLVWIQYSRNRNRAIVQIHLQSSPVWICYMNFFAFYYNSVFQAIRTACTLLYTVIHYQHQIKPLNNCQRFLLNHASCLATMYKY